MIIPTNELYRLIINDVLPFCGWLRYELVFFAQDELQELKQAFLHDDAAAQIAKIFAQRRKNGEQIFSADFAHFKPSCQARYHSNKPSDFLELQTEQISLDYETFTTLEHLKNTRAAYVLLVSKYNKLDHYVAAEDFGMFSELDSDKLHFCEYDMSAFSEAFGICIDQEISLDFLLYEDERLKISNYLPYAWPVRQALLFDAGARLLFDARDRLLFSSEEFSSYSHFERVCPNVDDAFYELGL